MDPSPARSEPSPPLSIGVWQGLADGNPDVDAIYRLVTPAEPVRFDKRPPVALGPGQYCPFNSQNTLWSPAAYPYLYLPVTVSFRFTDILRGYVAQRLLWHHGMHLGFTGASVYQDRNPHDLMRDFEDEIPCYRLVSAIAERLDGVALTDEPLENVVRAYESLVSADLVPKAELPYVHGWAADCRQASSGRSRAAA
jgi:hypothetical protein